VHNILISLSWSEGVGWLIRNKCDHLGILLLHAARTVRKEKEQLHQREGSNRNVKYKLSGESCQRERERESVNPRIEKYHDDDLLLLPSHYFWFLEDDRKPFRRKIG